MDFDFLYIFRVNNQKCIDPTSLPLKATQGGGERGIRIINLISLNTCFFSVKSLFLLWSGFALGTLIFNLQFYYFFVIQNVTLFFNKLFFYNFYALLYTDFQVIIPVSNGSISCCNGAIRYPSAISSNDSLNIRVAHLT